MMRDGVLITHLLPARAASFFAHVCHHRCRLPSTSRRRLTHHRSSHQACRRPCRHLLSPITATSPPLKPPTAMVGHLPSIHTMATTHRRVLLLSHPLARRSSVATHAAIDAAAPPVTGPSPRQPKHRPHHPPYRHAHRSPIHHLHPILRCPELPSCLRHESRTTVDCPPHHRQAFFQLPLTPPQAQSHRPSIPPWPTAHLLPLLHCQPSPLFTPPWPASKPLPPHQPEPPAIDPASTVSQVTASSFLPNQPLLTSFSAHLRHHPPPSQRRHPPSSLLSSSPSHQEMPSHPLTMADLPLLTSHPTAMIQASIIPPSSFHLHRRRHDCHHRAAHHHPP